MLGSLSLSKRGFQDYCKADVSQGCYFIIIKFIKDLRRLRSWPLGFESLISGGVLIRLKFDLSFIFGIGLKISDRVHDYFKLQ